jgi:methylenetetrahydrofolate--tRNA-(uracil-5-)-methyltransferase
MPPNFGILPALPQRIRNKQERYGQYRDRAFSDLAAWAALHRICYDQMALVR